jgi:hypothetical protein
MSTTLLSSIDSAGVASSSKGGRMQELNNSVMQNSSPSPPISTLASLLDTLGSLQNAFPSASSTRLHPFTSHSSDIPSRREKVLRNLTNVKASLESFRSSWANEKHVVDAQRPTSNRPVQNVSGQTSRELDSELERRKLGVIRVMMDW